MRRLAAIDWLLLGISLPIFLIGLVGSAVHGVRGDFVVPTFWATSAADEHSYPVVERIWSYPGAEASPLTVGDRLLRLDGSDLHGVSNAGLMLRWSQAAQGGARSLLLTTERGSVRADVHVVLGPGFYFPPMNWPWWIAVPNMLGTVGTALLLLVRAGHWHLARRNYVTSMLFAFWLTPYYTVATAPRCEIISDVLVLPLAQGLLLWNLNEFLPGLWLWGPGQRALAWTLALLQSASLAAMFWLPNAGLVGFSMQGLAGFGFAIAFLVAITRVYLRADPLGRRQIKWVVYGFYVFLLLWGLNEATLALGVLPEWASTLDSAAVIAWVAIPLGLLVAVAFYQFLDIDRLFSATLSYSILAILGVAVVLGVMPAASRAASDVFGLDPATGQLLMSLGLAAVLVPTHRIVRPWIDRWLFPERVTLEQGFEHLLAEISRTADMQELTQLVGERLDALLRPAVVVLYARAGDLFTPLAARGRDAPPTFATRSALIAALQERTTPLAAKRWTARWTASLTPFERAAIETLDVAVLVPIRRGAELTAFWCLGPKRSGDIYTPTDLALLGAVAGAISERPLALGEPRATGQPSRDPVVGAEESVPALDEPEVLPRNEAMESVGGVSGTVEQKGAASTADTRPLKPESVFRREGGYWTIAFAGTLVRLKDNKGLQFIAHLLRHPGQEFLALDLVDFGSRNGGRGPTAPQGAIGDATLDAEAKRAYKERLHELRDELEEAERFNDLGRAAQLQAEMHFIGEQLSAAVGLNDKDREAGGATERARLAVTKRIKGTLTTLGAVHPQLAHHLRACVKTGYLCSYTPPPDRAVAWQF